MDPIARFGEYATAFEDVYKSDDWSLLDPYFTDDAVYEIEADPPFGARHEGRAVIYKALKESLDNNDRRFASRNLELLEGPKNVDGAVWIRWRATYTLEGAPDFVMNGEETAHFEGDRISRLVDVFTEETQKNALAYLRAHGDKLPPPRA
ncbi:MAG: nuclear transport factor 2 family protein [Proteobacteria bacterium]|nr:nuclear transport factor 2 family protein [Pseudomonadota bacterium]MCZ6784528.1 nuclear transport factor 2 family protein [Pseudomonadota bacterium]